MRLLGRILNARSAERRGNLNLSINDECLGLIIYYLFMRKCSGGGCMIRKNLLRKMSEESLPD